MTIGFVPLPYGCRDIKIRALTSTDTVSGTSIDLPNAQTLSFSEGEDTTDLRGDDGLVAIHGKGPTIDWEVDGGGCALEIVKAMFGGTIVETGTTPNGIKTFTKTGTTVRPYFQVEGQAISDSGGDFHVLIYKCKSSGALTGQLTDGAFWITGAKGTGLPNASGQLYSFIQNETATPIT